MKHTKIVKKMIKTSNNVLKKHKYSQKEFTDIVEQFTLAVVQRHGYLVQHAIMETTDDPKEMNEIMNEITEEMTSAFLMGVQNAMDERKTPKHEFA